LLETRDKRFYFSLQQKDEMLSWKNDICSRIPLPPHDLNVLKQTPCRKQDYEEEEPVPDVEHLTAPSPYISIAPPIPYFRHRKDEEHLVAPGPRIKILPPAYSPTLEREDTMESPALRLSEVELARKAAVLEAKERDLERREEEIRRKEMELRLETRFLGIDYHRRQEIEPFYRLEVERERGPTQRLASTPYDVMSLRKANASKAKQG
jgi:hypothetical protein